jgi:cell division septation protein DedD
MAVERIPPGPAGGQESSKPLPPAVSAEAVKTVPEKVPPVTSAAENVSPGEKEPPPADAPSKANPAGIPVTTSPADKVSGNKPAETDGKIFTIQVAAVRERRAADQCYEKLKKNKYAPDTVQTIQSGGVTWYRLRCGQFASHDEAAPVIERLRKDGFSPILVRR